MDNWTGTKKQQQKANRTIFQLVRLPLTDKIEDELLKTKRSRNYKKPKRVLKKKLYHTNSISFVKF